MKGLPQSHLLIYATPKQLHVERFDTEAELSARVDELELDEGAGGRHLGNQTDDHHHYTTVVGAVIVPPLKHC